MNRSDNGERTTANREEPMSITVRELLRLPHLRLTLAAGQAGLDREVSWVHCSDLPAPWERYPEC